jgi:HEAT repeat protein
MRTGPGERQQPATDDDSSPVARLRQAVTAGHRGDRDEASSLTGDPDPAVRAAALGALARLDALETATLATAMGDPEPSVRQRACLLAGRSLGEGAAGVELVGAVLDRLVADDDAAVAESAAWALGEAGSRCPAEGVGALAVTARTHADPLCREAAVAALGAVGDPRGLDAVIDALDDRGPVRRRAAIALAAFEDPRADEGLRRCLDDRDWQVRQAAEELLGRD